MFFFDVGDDQSDLSVHNKNSQTTTSNNASTELLPPKRRQQKTTQYTCIVIPSLPSATLHMNNW